MTCFAALADSKVKAGTINEIEGGRPKDVDGQGDAEEGQHLHHLLRPHHLGQRRLDGCRGEPLGQHHHCANVWNPGVIVRGAEHQDAVGDGSQGGDQSNRHVGELELDQEERDDGEAADQDDTAEDSKVRRELNVLPTQLLEEEPETSADEDAAVIDGHEKVSEAESENHIARAVLALLENRPHALLDPLG